MTRANARRGRRGEVRRWYLRGHRVVVAAGSALVMGVVSVGCVIELSPRPGAPGVVRRQDVVFVDAGGAATVDAGAADADAVGNAEAADADGLTDH